MESGKLELLRQVAAGIAAQFGSGCEVVVHDLSRHPDHSIVAIFNGHVSGRQVGDGASPGGAGAAAQQRPDHPGSSVLPDEDAGRTDPQILHYLCPQPPGPGGGHSGHQLRHLPAAAGRGGHPGPGDHRGPGPGGAGEDRQRHGFAGGADPAVGGPGGQAGGADEQGRQDPGHPVSQPQRGVLGDEVRRQDRQYFGISKYTLYSYIDAKQQEGKTHD